MEGGHGVKRHLQQHFSYIVAVSYIGGGNRSTRSKQPTYRKSLTNFITVLYRLRIVKSGSKWISMIPFVLDQHALLDFHCASSLRQLSTEKHVAPLGHVILSTNPPVFGLKGKGQSVEHFLYFNTL